MQFNPAFVALFIHFSYSFTNSNIALFVQNATPLTVRGSLPLIFSRAYSKFCMANLRISCLKLFKGLTQKSGQTVMCEMHFYVDLDAKILDNEKASGFCVNPTLRKSWIEVWSISLISGILIYTYGLPFIHMSQNQ